MTSPDQPDGAQCPVPLEILARLLPVSDEQAREAIRRSVERQPAELAIVCYGHSHLRDLGFWIAAFGSEAMLTRTAGQVGCVVFHQARQISTSTTAMGGHIRGPSRWRVALEQFWIHLSP
ncbi:hypothetical protein [Aureimonas pseudogalii]|uniref:Uncharacterized protein n=1 Tax=Aureimonas pseudogalii TaxID=1744844 RepID=A0A7W6MMH9_9HYPH|nr:hypothetical protein [Aureimonas pseudogalii]MBB4000799.1 hypothetical protein [Aureimonas pseudogalii]